MNVNDFIQGFKNAIDKGKYCERHIVNSYIPYRKKVEDCKYIIRQSQSDFPFRAVIFSLLLISSYYDVTLGNDYYDDYDSLAMSGAVNVLIGHIPTDEYQTWNVLLNMIGGTV